MIRQLPTSEPSNEKENTEFRVLVSDGKAKKNHDVGAAVCHCNSYVSSSRSSSTPVSLFLNDRTAHALPAYSRFTSRRTRLSFAFVHSPAHIFRDMTFSRRPESEAHARPGSNNSTRIKVRRLRVDYERQV